MSSGLHYYCHDECENVQLKSHLRLAKHSSPSSDYFTTPVIIIALIVTPYHNHWGVIILRNMRRLLQNISEKSALCDSPLPPPRQCSPRLRSRAGCLLTVYWVPGTKGSLGSVSGAPLARCFPTGWPVGWAQLSAPGQSDNPPSPADMKMGNCPMVVRSYGSDLYPRNLLMMVSLVDNIRTLLCFWRLKTRRPVLTTRVK